MITIISPAKTLDFNKMAITHEYSEPIFKEETSQLIGELKRYSLQEIEELMSISHKLAELNYKRYKQWNKEHSIENSKQAILAYSGDVYHGMKAEDFNEEQLKFSQQHVRIISGLYGVLRPLDLIQPYRLEMSIKLKNPKGVDLYSFWREKITDFFNKEIGEHKDNTLINLASNEYFSAIDKNKFKGKIITPIFKEYKNGNYKIIRIYAKKARGAMAKYIVENEINSPEHIKNFNQYGYKYNEESSTDSEWIFVR